jgi:hypothetical protein
MLQTDSRRFYSIVPEFTAWDGEEYTIDLCLVQTKVSAIYPQLPWQPSCLLAIWVYDKV